MRPPIVYYTFMYQIPGKLWVNYKKPLCTHGDFRSLDDLKKTVEKLKARVPNLGIIVHKHTMEEIEP